MSANTASLDKSVKSQAEIAPSIDGARIWFDVEDLLRHFDSAAQPTGIPRVCLDFLKAAHELYPSRVRLCRHIRHSGRMEAVSFAQLLTACSSIAEPTRDEPRTMILLQKMRRAVRYIYRGSRRWLGDRLSPHQQCAFRPGEILACLGSPWRNPYYAMQVRAAKASFGLRFVLFLHDILPFTHPQFVDESFLRIFKPWLSQTLPLSDLVLTSSQYNCRAIDRLCKASGWEAVPIRTTALGCGIADARSASERPPWPEPYILFVSTLEIRKNHRLMVIVWRRLIERHGPAAVPALVFAGRLGWRVDDVVRELRESRGLGGKIFVARALSDEVLVRAYRGALFTVFPSFCEGWGLPVAESLSCGTPCIASDTTSIPEVGRDLVDYIDPLDEEAALTMVERALFDKAYLAERRRQIAECFQPVKWATCVSSFLAHLDEILGTAPRQAP